MGVYYLSAIKSTGTGGSTTVTPTSDGTEAAYTNYACTFTNTSGSPYSGIILQPQLAFKCGSVKSDGTIDITAYIWLAKSNSASYQDTLQVIVSQESMTIGSATHSFSNYKSQSYNDIKKEPWLSDALASYTTTLEAGTKFTCYGSLTFQGWGSGTYTMSTPTVTVYSPVSSAKITFKTSHGNIVWGGSATHSSETEVTYVGATITYPAVSPDSYDSSDTASKTVYLYFNSNGGSSAATKSGTVSGKTTYTNKFSQWSDGNGAGSSVYVSGSKTVEAQFKVDGQDTTYTRAATINGFETPTRNGYNFAGWYDSDGTKKTSVQIWENATLYAKWYPIMNFDSGVSGISPTQKTVSNKLDGIDFTWPSLTKKSYLVNGTKNISISYDSQGGSYCSPTSLTCNTSTTWTADDYWYWTGGSNTWVTLGGTGSARAGSFIAHWAAGETSVKEVAIGTLPTPTRTGYTFKGWTYNGTDVSKSTKFSNNATLTAKWTPVTYTVTYNLNAGSSAITPTSIDSITKTYGTNVKISDETPKFNDGSKKFSYWSCNGKVFYPSGTLTDTFYQTGVSKYELTANWVYVPYTVNFVYYNGSWKNPDQRTYTKADVENTWRMPTPVWDNHSFVGWTTVVPSNFWNTGGVYESIDDIESSVTNNLINPYEVTISMPDRYTPWGNTTILGYYGVWVKTGKKLKIQKDSQSAPEWVDMQSMYIKTDSGWQRVKDLWVKTASGWKHEI